MLLLTSTLLAEMTSLMFDLTSWRHFVQHRKNNYFMAFRHFWSAFRLESGKMQAIDYPCLFQCIKKHLLVGSLEDDLNKRPCIKTNSSGPSKCLCMKKTWMIPIFPIWGRLDSSVGRTVCLTTSYIPLPGGGFSRTSDEYPSVCMNGWLSPSGCGGFTGHFPVT